MRENKHDYFRCLFKRLQQQNLYITSHVNFYLPKWLVAVTVLHATACNPPVFGVDVKPCL